MMSLEEEITQSSPDELCVEFGVGPWWVLVALRGCASIEGAAQLKSGVASLVALRRCRGPPFGGSSGSCLCPSARARAFELLFDERRGNKAFMVIELMLEMALWQIDLMS